MYEMYRGAIRGIVEELNYMQKVPHIMIKVDSDFEPSPVVPLNSVNINGVPQKVLILNLSRTASMVHYNEDHLVVEFTVNGAHFTEVVPYMHIIMVYNRDDSTQTLDLTSLAYHVAATVQVDRAKAALSDEGQRESTLKAYPPKLKIVK